MSKRTPDVNGFIEVKDNPISKVGVYPYLGSQIGAEDPSKIYYVYRPADELSKQSTIESFKLLPWVDEHAMLGDGFMAAEKKGVHGVIGEDVYFEYPYLKANIKVFSNSLTNKLNGGKIELSPGYRCEYIKERGVFEGTAYDYVQRGLLGNHLASVHQGRTGPDVAVLDHLKITLDAGLLSMDEENKPAPAPAPAEEKPATPPPAAEKKEGEEGEEGEAKAKSMTMEDATQALEQVMPMIEKIMSFMKGGPAKPAQPGQNPAQPPPAPKPAGVFDSATTNEETAMDAKEIQALKDEVAALRTSLKATQDAAAAVKEAADLRDLSQKLNQCGIACDGSTVVEMAKAAAAKVGLACDDSNVVALVNAFLHARKPASVELYSMAQDSAALPSSGPVSSALYN